MIIIENRYRDNLEFNVNETEKFIIISGAKYVRSGFETVNQGILNPKMVWSFIDPSGGPFIGVGQDLGEFHENLKGFIVKSIEQGDDENWILNY